jgi:hypothetical protein
MMAPSQLIRPQRGPITQLAKHNSRGLGSQGISVIVVGRGVVATKYVWTHLNPEQNIKWVERNPDGPFGCPR